MSKPKPKVGIALSGASGRAIAHIAVLEVLKKHDIPIDILVGCSSGALIAASYALNTMNELKNWFQTMTTTKLFRFWSVRHSRGGIFHLNGAEAEAELNLITKGLNFEDISGMKLAFVASDLNTGELVILDHGSINQAFKASVAVPVLLEPVVIDGRVLLDGGLVNIVPTKPTKELGADLVIGVNASGSRFMYEKKLPLWRFYRFLKKLSGIEFIVKKVLPKLLPKPDPDEINIPRIWSVLSKSFDLSFKVEEEWDEKHVDCDLMIEPSVAHYGKTEFDSLQQIYQESIQSAEAAIPKIKQLIHDYQER